MPTHDSKLRVIKAQAEAIIRALGEVETQARENQALALERREIERGGEVAETVILGRLVANQSNVAKTARELHVTRKRVDRVRVQAGLPPNRVQGPRMHIDRESVFAVLAANRNNVKATSRITGVPETTVRRLRDRLVRERATA